MRNVSLRALLGCVGDGNDDVGAYNLEIGGGRGVVRYN